MLLYIVQRTNLVAVSCVMFECMISRRQHVVLHNVTRVITNSSSFCCCGASPRRVKCLQLLGCGRAWQPRQHAALGLADEARGIPECLWLRDCAAGLLNNRLDGYKISPKNLKNRKIFGYAACGSSVCCAGASAVAFVVIRTRRSAGHLSADPHSIGAVCVRCPIWAVIRLV